MAGTRTGAVVCSGRAWIGVGVAVSGGADGGGDGFRAGELPTQGRGQSLVGDGGHGPGDGAHGVLDDDVVAGAGEQDPNGGTVAVVGLAPLLVDSGQVEPELADRLGGGGPGRELDGDVSA